MKTFWFAEGLTLIDCWFCQAWLSILAGEIQAAPAKDDMHF